MSDIPGEWQPAIARGTLLEDGWGAAMGYPGIIPDPEGDEVSGYLFTSDELTSHWSRLDDFEGEGYRRTPIIVTTSDNQTVDAWVYALSQHQSGD